MKKCAITGHATEWLSKAFDDYEYSRPQGAAVAVRRYIGVLAVLVPMHIYLTHYFTTALFPEELRSWSTNVAVTHALMILPSFLFLMACVASARYEKYEQTLLMIVNAAYIGLGARFSYIDITEGGAGNLGGATFLICSLATSVMYLAPPYVTAPFFAAAMIGAAVTFYLLDPNIFMTHPGLLVNLFIALPMTITMSALAWQHFNARTILARELETTKLLLERTQTALDKVVEIDELTGLYNKRRFCEITNRDWAKAARQVHGSTGSLLLIDIDKLQQVNNTYGHDIGDKVIRRIARAIQRLLRTTDVAGRVGGDMFSVFLPETTRAGAAQVAEKIRSDIEQYTITFPQTGTHERIELKVTVSIGIASWFAAPHSVRMGPDDLNLLADFAMRNAKNAGRNRIMVS